MRLFFLFLFSSALITNAAFAMPKNAYVYPLLATKVSSDYGLRKHPIKKAVRHHHGMDLAAPKGAPIRVIKSGMVVFADPYAGYGNLVVVQHGNGLTSHYGHCNTILVKPGQRVRAGQIIATVGSTGISTGPHLHFEMRIKGEPYDPERFLPGIADLAEG
jgi:murein DD-endopeptidase MepM/ murein hydrolase activator NlpD